MAISKTLRDKLNKQLSAGTISARDYATQYSGGKAPVANVEKLATKYNEVKSLPNIRKPIAPIAPPVAPVAPVPFEQIQIKPVQPVQPITPVAPLQDTQAVKDLIAKEKRDLLVKKLKSAFNITSGRLGQEEAGVAPRFRTERGQIGVEDTMSREAQAKTRAIGGLSASGSVSQENIAQNVLKGGQLTTSRTNESNQRADIERRLSEATQLYSTGKATAETELEVANLTSRLEALDAQQAAATKQAETAEQRQYDEGLASTERQQQLSDLDSKRLYELTKADIDNANDRETLILKQDMDIEMANIDAQIARAEAANDYAYKNSLYEKKFSLDAKLADIDNKANIAEIEARKVADEETEEDKPSYTQSQLNSEFQNQIDRAINKETGNSYEELTQVEEEIIERNTVLENIKQLAMSGDITEEQIKKVLKRFGNITEDEIGLWKKKNE